MGALDDPKDQDATMQTTFDLDDLRGLVAEDLTPAFDHAAGGPGAVGLEVEHFLAHVTPDGRPMSRLTLDEVTGLLDDHPQLAVEPPVPSRLTGWRCQDGGRLLPEPGAQLEHAGVPYATAAGAINAMNATAREVAGFAATRGVAMYAAGLDPFTPAGATPQYLAVPRYPAMNRYFGRRSAHGHQMMTGSASIQVNLDLGADPAQVAARWATAMLVAPLATAAFACSPVPGAVNGRAVVWQWLDPTRTGVPAAFVAGVDDPVEVLTRQALHADVLLFADGGRATPGTPGFSFGHWLAEGHPVHGRPTRADAVLHLSTLFPEVRTRGVMEMRSIDALPHRWRAVPVVLYCGLLYDQRAREHVRALLDPGRRGLEDQLRLAAHVGLADPRLCALAVEVWTAAAEGARRLPAGYLDPADISRAERYIDTYVLRGRGPSDELRERLAEGPAQALAWTRDPETAMNAC